MKFVIFFFDIIFAAQLLREISSAGSEHLPYKQRVTGSNPVSPTQYRKPFKQLKPFFYCLGKTIFI
jgi:hypothetical protein